MLGGCGGHLPVRSVGDLSRPDVLRYNDGSRAGQDSAPRREGIEAQRVVDPRDPVMCERALVLIHDPVRDPLGQIGAVDLEIPLAPDAEVPATENKARVINVVVEVMVREEEVIDLRQRYPHLHQLVRRRGAAVEHQPLIAHVHDVTGTESLGRRTRCARPDNVNLQSVPSCGARCSQMRSATRLRPSARASGRSRRAGAWPPHTRPPTTVRA